MRLFKRSVHKLFTIRSKRFEFFEKYPVEQQQKVLNELLHTARKTEWGQQFGYKNIITPEQFSQQVPLGDYDSLKPYIERMISGEKDVLWPGKVKWFAKSSGTTSDKSKFIPISDASLKYCHLTAPFDVFTFYMINYPTTNVFRGKNLTIGGSHKVSSLGGSTRTGDLSAIMLANLSFFSKLKNTPSSEIALIPDFEEKIEQIINTTLNENITSFTGVPSWFLVMIKRILEKTGKDNLLEIWPNLEVFVHGGVNFEPYREQYKQLIPSSKMNYVNSYNASEGFFAVQDSPDSADMRLMLDYGIYFEFIDMREFYDQNPKVLPMADVEVGVNYAMVISTNGGLWRYVIGDTIMFTSLFPHKIKITGRTRHYINAFGEELIIDNAENGLKEACEKTGAIISEFTAGPIFMGTGNKGAHQWIIEFEKLPNDLEQFADILDEALQSLNSDYEAKRYKNMTINRLELVNAPKGTFYDWMKSRGKVGGQNKIPRLSNTREYLDPLMDIVNAK